jgi:catechol 2,3-dioxygenase-like lactoylglutathione lyase family enzyme
MTDAPLGTTTITQIGIIVGNIAAKARAWSEIFGLPLPEIRETAGYEQTQAEYDGQPTGARAKLAFFNLGQVQVELIEPVDGPSTWREQLERHGDSLHHIAFRIQGMGEKVAYLGGHGIPLVQRGEYTGGRYAYLDGIGQLGTILELLEND